MSLQVEPAELAGRLARDAHGRPLGEVETVFADEEGVASRFVAIDTVDGRVVVPVDGAEVDPTVYALDLPYMADRISGAPTVAPDVEELDSETERRVVEHFGAELGQGGPQASTVPVPAPPPPDPTELMEPVEVVEPDDEPAEDEEVVLHSEQLVVETERVPAQHVRVRKEIVEEEVTITVVLRHEELVIEREPIAPGDAPPAETATGPRLDEPPLEIVLWAEEPVVSTRAVPTERVRVLRTLGSEQQDLTAQLRHERASFDHAKGDDQR